MKKTFTSTLLLTGLTIAGNAQVCYNTAAPHWVRSYPPSLINADFNSDGVPDIVAVSYTVHVANLAVGTGAGNFVGGPSGTSFMPVGNQPHQVVTADVNEDGHLDLITANHGAHNVSVLLGTGTGTFSAATNFSAVNIPNSVAVGDYNGDTHLDLAVSGSGTVGTGNVAVLMGTGTGSFGAPAFFTVQDVPIYIVSADFNGDGDPDLATANLVADNVSVLMNNGSGSFLAAVHYAAGDQPYALVTDDFNGDGRADLATANSSSANVSVLLGSSTGIFSTAVNYSAGNNPYGITSADLDADGIKDLIVANYIGTASNNVSILMGTGSGVFGAPVNLSADVFPHGVITGDFDGDGKLDIATSNYNDGMSGISTMSVFLNCTITSAIENQGMDNAISVYPNPTNGMVTLAVQNNLAIQRVAVYNALGANVSHMQVAQAGNVNLDLAAQPAGIYFVNAYTAQGLYTFRIEKQ